VLPGTLIKGFNKSRLRNILALFFMALAVPTAILIWQAYSQLKWEAFHQHRGVAEELTSRIDARVNDMIITADARSFADYTFLVISGDPSAKFVQRSPLSVYPVAANLPGVLGYFQVDSNGVFSTPLLPPDGTQAVSLGIGESEYSSRLQLAQEIQAVLADNYLAQSRHEVGARSRLATLPAAPEEDKDTDALVGRVGETDSQQNFDELNQPRKGAPLELRFNRIGKVSDLKLDANLQKKSEEIEREDIQEQASADGFAYSPSRSKRREQIALPESVVNTGGEILANVAMPTDLRINTFESEIDPFEFSLLDSGHFVLFRKVWRDGERYIQGMLVDQETFTQDIIGARFKETALAGMSNLILAYQDDVIRIFGEPGGLGDLLYRSRLTAPLDGLELIFSINRLPPGPGATVLGWVTLILIVVLVGGFLILYRMALSQINLARQQQGFVSAVSHELKTPLTSIRMYGEMLKEGWADEEKRQTYYEFIHEESERLTRLISNVLQLAKITRNEPQFDPKPIRVGELMSNTESKISSQVERAGFELRFNRDDDADQATINMDEDCFAQIIINLVDNAIKFSRNAKHKTIEIGSKLAGDNRVLFSIRDYGPGIPQDQMKKIFQLFYRSESELTRETVGTGIGLAIVHQLTFAMNGTVDMINAEPGAEFRVWFSSIEQE